MAFPNHQHPTGSATRSGPYELTPVQSLAWHSAHVGERETTRREVRAACRRRLEVDPWAQAVEIRDLGGAVLERVEPGARRVIRPLFSFFGAKWRLAPRYPAPAHRTIVEPCEASGATWLPFRPFATAKATGGARTTEEVVWISSEHGVQLRLPEVA